MATLGPLYPGTTATLANAGTLENAEAWLNPGNIVSDNATESTIVASTYDTPDISQLLVASNFGFTTSGTIDGITVEIDRRSIIAGSGADFRVQLATGTTFATLVGTNKAATGTTWPTATAIASYGGTADTWSAGLTSAQVNAAGFAVFLSASAKIANADIGVDFIRVTVTYTPPTNTTITPPTATLTTTAFIPVISTTNHQLVTPPVTSLVLATFAPIISMADAPDRLLIETSLYDGYLKEDGSGVLIKEQNDFQFIPPTGSLVLSTFAPVVGLKVIPGVTALTTAVFAPVVQLAVVPGVTALTIATFAPVVGLKVIPSVATLTLTGYAPDVVIPTGVNVIVPLATLATASFVPVVKLGVVPGVTALTLTSFAPVVRLVVTPGVTALTVTGLAPVVGTGVVPGVTALTLATFAPVIKLGVVPGVTGLTLTPFAPVIGLQVVPGVASLVLSGLVPTATIVTTPITPGMVALVLTMYPPTVSTTIEGITIGVLTAEFFPRRRMQRDHRRL